MTFRYFCSQSIRGFNLFRSCAANFVRTNCSPIDQQFLPTYFIDKGQERAWTCGATEFYDINRQSNSIDRQSGPYYGAGSYGSSSYGSSGLQPPYGQGSYGSMGQVGSTAYGQPQYGQPGYGQPGQPGYGQPGYGQPGYNSHAGHNHPPGGYGGDGYVPSVSDNNFGQQGGMYGSGGMPGYGGRRERESLVSKTSCWKLLFHVSHFFLPRVTHLFPFWWSNNRYLFPLSNVISCPKTPDRQYNLFPAENCVEKSAYFARSCEDTLLQRQREARNGRTATDVQRRLCWYVLQMNFYITSLIESISFNWKTVLSSTIATVWVKRSFSTVEMPRRQQWTSWWVKDGARWP